VLFYFRIINNIYIYYYDNGNESSQFPSTNEGIFLVCFQFQVCFTCFQSIFKVTRGAATLSREGGHRGELGGPRHLEPVRDVMRDVREVPQRERRAGWGKHPADAAAQRPNRRGPAPAHTKKKTFEKHFENT